MSTFEVLKSLIGKRVILDMELENWGELHMAGVLSSPNLDDEQAFSICVNKPVDESNASIIFTCDDVCSIDTEENEVPVILL